MLTIKTCKEYGIEFVVGDETANETLKNYNDVRDINNQYEDSFWNDEQVTKFVYRTYLSNDFTNSYRDDTPVIMELYDTRIVKVLAKDMMLYNYKKHKPDIKGLIELHPELFI